MGNHVSANECDSGTNSLCYPRYHCTGLDRPCGFQEVEAPRYQDSRHMKVVRLLTLRTGRLYLPGNIPGIHFCQRPSQTQGHSAAGRIMPIKNSSDAIGNRARNLPGCSSMPQPTAPPCAPLMYCKQIIFEGFSIPSTSIVQTFGF